jgi:hypothetical protein
MLLLRSKKTGGIGSPTKSCCDGLVVRTVTKVVLSCFSASAGGQWIECAVKKIKLTQESLHVPKMLHSHDLACTLIRATQPHAQGKKGARTE